MKTVLVTGASGFIGRHCLPRLVQQGYRVHAVSRSGKKRPIDNVEWHQLDVLHSNSVEALLAKLRPTHLLHLAWFVEHGLFWTSPENDAWATASEHLIREFLNQGGERFVGVGTCAEYAWSPRPLNESLSPLDPTTVYGKAKKRVFKFCETLPLSSSWAWGRVFFVYGPHENPQRLIPRVIGSLVKGNSQAVTSGQQVRSFLYVEDQADSLVRLLDSNLKGAINMASGEALTLKEVLNDIGRKLQRPDLVRYGEKPDDPNDPPVIVADTSRLRNELKWHPVNNLDMGLNKTIEWWRKHESCY